MPSEATAAPLDCRLVLIVQIGPRGLNSQRGVEERLTPRTRQLAHLSSTRLPSLEDCPQAHHAGGLLDPPTQRGRTDVRALDARGNLSGRACTVS